MKYEFKATTKLLLPFYLIVLAIAGVSRVLSSIPFLNEGFIAIIPVFFQFAVIVLIIGVAFASFFLMVFRFYKNHVTDEGYLMFTLPVSITQLLFSKLIVAVCFMVLGFITCMLAFTILYLGTDIWTIFIDTLHDIQTVLQASFGDYTTTLLILYMLLTIILSLISQLLFMYLSIALGQLLSQKHKIIGTIAAYFVIYTIMQIISTAIVLVYVFLFRIDINSNAPPISLLIITLLLSSAYMIGAFLGTKYLFNKKLNLE